MECVLAIGVIAFGFVSIFSLLPVGMGIFRQAMDYSVGSHIAQLLINEAHQTDFDLLTAKSEVAKPVRYFDDQGNERKEATDPGVVYHVNTLVAPTTTYPGAAASNASVATVTIQVANNPGNLPFVLPPGTRLWAVTNRQPLVNYSVLVARSK